MNPIALLLPLGLLFAILRIARPTPRRLAGTHVLTAPLPLLARARLHAASATILLVLTLVLVALGMTPWWVLLAVLAALAALISWPVAYVLTTAGIRVGHTGLRRWTEFAGVVRAPGGAFLQGVGGARGFRIWLSDSRGDDEFVLLLRKMIKGAYQGRGDAAQESLGSDPSSVERTSLGDDSDHQPASVLMTERR